MSDLDNYLEDTQEARQFKDMLMPGLVARLGALGAFDRDINIELRGDGDLYLVEITRTKVLLTKEERKSWPETRGVITPRVEEFAKVVGPL